MKKILFLLNDSLKYKKLINVLVDSNIRVNILEGYTDSLINIINEIKYDMIFVEDDVNSKRNINLIRYLSRRFIDKVLILISDVNYNTNDDNKFEIISRDKLVETYIGFFEEYGIKIKSKAKDTIDLFEEKAYINNPSDTVINYIARKNIVERNKHIVLIDDDDISLLILANILRQHGYHVTIFNQSIEAVKKINEMIKRGKKIDLFILDLIMPDIDGFAFLQCLRENKKLKDIGVLISSARNDCDSIKKVAQYNVKGYLLKPYNRDLIIARVKDAI